jgi:tetratricopeptide (TPR) repeat protein
MMARHSLSSAPSPPTEDEPAKPYRAAQEEEEAARRRMCDGDNIHSNNKTMISTVPPPHRDKECADDAPFLLCRNMQQRQGEERNLRTNNNNNQAHEQPPFLPYQQQDQALVVAPRGRRRPGDDGDHDDHTMMSSLVLICTIAATLLIGMGKLSEAEPWSHAALVWYRRWRYDDNDHLDTIDAILRHANLLRALGRLKTAAPLYREVIVTLLRLHGIDHPTTLHSIYQYAQVLSQMGHWQEASQLYEMALSGMMIRDNEKRPRLGTAGGHPDFLSDDHDDHHVHYCFCRLANKNQRWTAADATEPDLSLSTSSSTAAVVVVPNHHDDDNSDDREQRGSSSSSSLDDFGVKLVDDGDGAAVLINEGKIMAESAGQADATFRQDRRLAVASSICFQPSKLSSLRGHANKSNVDPDGQLPYHRSSAVSNEVCVHMPPLSDDGPSMSVVYTPMHIPTKEGKLMAENASQTTHAEEAKADTDDQVHLDGASEWPNAEFVDVPPLSQDGPSMSNTNPFMHILMKEGTSMGESTSQSDATLGPNGHGAASSTRSQRSVSHSLIDAPESMCVPKVDVVDQLQFDEASELRNKELVGVPPVAENGLSMISIARPSMPMLMDDDADEDNDGKSMIECVGSPINIATTSAGVAKCDFFVRGELGKHVYFDFFEEAFNYVASKGYSSMSQANEKHWVDLVNKMHQSVEGGMQRDPGVLLMVLSRPVPDQTCRQD